MIAARAARRAADEYVAQHRRRGARAAAAAAARRSTRRSRAAAAARARVRPPPVGGPRARWTRTSLALQTAAEEAIRGEHQRQAAAQVSVANVITSLRLCSTLDWSQYFESVSLVESVLQRDPAGVYGAHGLPQPRPLSPGGGGSGRRHRGGPGPGGAARGRERAPGRRGRPRHARGARRIPPDRQGPRRPRGRRGVPPAPRAARCGASSSRHATVAYLGSIALVDRRAARRSASPTRTGSAGSPWPLAWVALLLLLPASEVAIAVVQSLCARFARPRRLPRLDFQGGVPESARTMVVVPTLLTSVEGSAS